MSNSSTIEGYLTEVPCEFCGQSIEVGQGTLPYHCPHCAKVLRPESDSILDHFYFAFFYRLFRYKGRATRKEFWSFFLVCTFLLILFWFFLFSFSEALTFILGYLSLFSYFIIILPVLVRRIHDVSFSGKWVLALFVIDLLAALVTVVLGYFYVRELSLIEYANMQTIDNQPHTFLYSNNSCEFSDTHPYIYKVIHIILMPFIVFSRYCLSLFILVLTMLDSTKGGNRHGVSRKYLTY